MIRPADVTPTAPARCRSFRTVKSADGQRAKIRCGLDLGHDQAHAKHVTFLDPEIGPSVARWFDGEQRVQFEPPVPPAGRRPR